MNTADSSLLASLGMLSDSSELPEIQEPSLPIKSNHYSHGPSSSVEERALDLLGSGVSPESCAAALGVTPGLISQLLAKDSFSTEVATIRYKNLQKHNERDGKYDGLEDALIKKLEASLGLLVRPESILKAISIVNSATRRGQSTPQQVTNTQNIVQLTLPAKMAAKITINIDNQVVKAGDQELLTMQSGNLLKQVEDAETVRLENNTSSQQETHQQDNPDIEDNESVPEKGIEP